MIHKVSLVTRRISVERIIKQVQQRSAGAVILFLGIVRDRNLGRSVSKIDYSMHPKMARAQLLKIVRHAIRKYKLIRVCVSHRVGVLKLGEVSVAIAVSSVHRKQAFDGARFIIERLKEDVPIWKKEFFKGGSAWIGAQT